MKRFLTVISAAALMAGIANADAISERQAAYKTIGQTMKALGAMAQGGTAFNADVARTGLMQIESAAASLPGLFPEGSGEGGETEASPAIWEKPAEFQAAMDKFVSDTKLDAAPEDEFELQEKLEKIGSNCKACHQQFRIEKL